MWETSLFFSDQCQAEVKQRGVFEPRGPLAEAVHEERHQQVSVRINQNVWIVCLQQQMPLLSPTTRLKQHMITSTL